MTTGSRMGLNRESVGATKERPNHAGQRITWSNDSYELVRYLLVTSNHSLAGLVEELTLLISLDRLWC